MGLDMNLSRFPRYKGYGPMAYHAFDEYMEWKGKGKDKECTLEEWCGVSEDQLPAEEDFPFFESQIATRYWCWDDQHKYPHERTYEDIAYWRKANMIHKWFVGRVQGGVDDCEYHDEVTKADLEALRDACKEVLEESVLVDGKIKNGYTFGGGKEVPNYVDGKKVANPKAAKRLLPTVDGFFFGGTDYDEYYINDIRYTYEVVCKILAETDFDKQMIYYSSSW